MTSPLQDAIATYIDAQGGADGIYPTAIDGLALMRSSSETLPHHQIYRPVLCIVAQGAKQIMLGEETFDYDEMQSLVVSLELPLAGRVARASPDRPFLGLALEFDIGQMREVLQQMSQPPRPGGDAGLGVFVGDIGEAVADGVLRLIRLLATPDAIAMLAPAIKREICFWLLSGRHGSEICKLTHADGHTPRIAQAIHLLRDDFARPIRIAELARAARMSASSFHQHFKALTAMTPLQYQKHLRLLEARRLMLADEATATSAAYRVGYESASQFSREYARMFGAPPRRDRVRAMAG